jgi:hypothetical protein
MWPDGTGCCSQAADLAAGPAAPQATGGDAPHRRWPGTDHLGLCTLKPGRAADPVRAVGKTGMNLISLATSRLGSRLIITLCRILPGTWAYRLAWGLACYLASRRQLPFVEALYRNMAVVGNLPEGILSWRGQFGAYCTTHSAVMSTCSARYRQARKPSTQRAASIQPPTD